jgi:pimeloyl-ACP methyl ester carboxylesterase
MSLVFIHGAGNTGAAWHLQEEHFPGSQTITLPGHPEGAPMDSIDGYADWVRDYARENNLGRMVLAGHSMGGGIALAYALKYPDEVNGLVLASTGARLRVNPEFLGTLREHTNEPPDWILDQMEPFYAHVEKPVAERVRARQKDIPVSVYVNDYQCCDRFDIMDKIGEIRVPTLVICGDKDIMTPVKYSRYLADHIPGSRITIIPDAGHPVMLEKPDEVNKAIDRFLNSLDINELQRSPSF